MLDAPFISVRALRKSYVMGGRPIEVLRGIDLTVVRGEFLAVRGASGAGKSTLLHLLGGLDLPNSGEIVLDSANLRQLSAAALAEFRNRRVGLIFQAYHLLPELSALENVTLPARMARVPGALATTKAREMLARVGLGERLEHRPSELSGGEQQRVAIARALINNPDFILADEPTGNLDSHTGQDIIRLLSDLRSESRATLIMATHDDHIAAHAARSIEVVDGQVAA
ncbi:MAG TPA: ABC transporter ATP-binding protein [Verrucomicrobiae bacterium]|jgi:ABC-type lipoprotein export system ATPase subunit|nr:ABC transporter ATP-binding protein [Verrucomicrobiae bacterium]